MMTVALGIALVLVCFAAIHAACAGTAWSWKTRDESLTGELPAVAVVLSVRGCDPTLRPALSQLLAQDYEPYQVRVIVDHPADPAAAIVGEVIANSQAANRCRLETLQAVPKNSSLKCAAIAQAVDSLSDADIIVTVDADVVPDRLWLKRLVSPLRDPAVGAATGNHWFEPGDLNAGSLVRSLWNAGSLFLTSFFQNPWGGSCAMRMSDIRESELIGAWRTSAVDDGPIRQAMARLGRRIVFVPESILVNRESCSLRFAFEYIARILTWSRMYDPSFRWTVAHVFVNGVPVVAAWLWLIACAASGCIGAASVVAAGLIGHALLMWGSYLLIRAGVARMAAARSEKLGRLGWMRLLRLVAATPLAMVVYAAAMIRAVRARFVRWRGVWYFLSPSGSVTLLNYEPYRAAKNDQTSKDSVG